MTTGADPGPIAAEYRVQMNALAAVLDEILNGENCPPEARKVGFFLTIFEFGREDGRFNYISNAEKLDVRAMLKDVIARLEGRMMPPQRDDGGRRGAS